LAETRLAETTIGRRPIDRKPQLADVTISRKHDWPKTRARYRPPARFRPISSIFAVLFIDFLYFRVYFIFHYSFIQFRIMENENFHFQLQRMVKELQKEQHITKNHSASSQWNSFTQE
jgi:hypothetical protein